METLTQCHCALIKRGTLDTERHTEREDGVERRGGGRPRAKEP